MADAVPRCLDDGYPAPSVRLEVTSTMPLIRIARVGRAHGLNGELTIDDCSLSADELLALGSVSWRGRDGTELTLGVHAARPAHNRLLVQFRGVTSREAAARLTLGELLIEASRLPDPGPGQTYAYRLIGLPVETVEGRRLGVLEDIIPTGANRVFVVQGEREWLIPANDEVLRRVDLEAGLIVVALPAGLEDV